MIRGCKNVFLVPLVKFMTILGCGFETNQLIYKLFIIFLTEIKINLVSTYNDIFEFLKFFFINCQKFNA